MLQRPGAAKEKTRGPPRRYLVGRQMVQNGLREGQLEFAPAALQAIIRDYTREAGVRSLEREIGAVCRRVAVEIAEGQRAGMQVDEADLAGILGAGRYDNEVALRTGLTGVATGLAWTPVGGDILFVEASRTIGDGRLILTGQLGEVMKESAQAALTLVKTHAASLGIEVGSFEKSDVHVHVPAGAIPKDGPSAGVAIFVALASLFVDQPVRNDTAMTGEISLRGLVLPVGGIKDKVLAAMRAGITRVLLPTRNRRDLDEVPAEAQQKLEFVFLGSVDDALANALRREGTVATADQRE